MCVCFFSFVYACFLLNWIFAPIARRVVISFNFWIKENQKKRGNIDWIEIIWLDIFFFSAHIHTWASFACYPFDVKGQKCVQHEYYTNGDNDDDGKVTKQHGIVITEKKI